MKRIGFIVVLLCASMALGAWEYEEVEADTTHSVQIRTEADFTKKWHNGIHLGIHEELRFDVYNSEHGPSFNRSYTTLLFSYTPVVAPYIKWDTGYSLKLLGDKGWSDANEFLRHRVFFSVTGQYKTEYIKLSLRERALVEMRTDSVNPLEKNRYNWELRSRLGAEVHIPGQSIKPYVWVEVINTLNAPEYEQKNGHQYISSVRTQAGIHWRFSRLSSMNLYYRFVYNYHRDINITKKNGYIQLEEETGYQHAIGIAYSLDW